MKNPNEIDDLPSGVRTMRLNKGGDVMYRW